MVVPVLRLRRCLGLPNAEKWFPIPRETFNVAIYSLLGFYKIVILVFNLVPYVALLIVRETG